MIMDIGQITNIFKFVIVGDSLTGKSGLFNRICNSKYSDRYIQTIGVDFGIKSVRSHGRNIKMQIYDTSGDNRFHSIVTTFLKNTTGVFIVCSMDNINTYYSINYWINEIRKKSDDCEIIIVSNKFDLKFTIDNYDEIMCILNKTNLDNIEVSSKDGTNINTMIKLMNDRVISNPKLLDMSITTEEKIKLQEYFTEKEDNICCCNIL
jgi:Ras-related protein Rab-1A